VTDKKKPIQTQNDFLVLISGESSSGKSAAFRNIKDPEGVMYLNTEVGKKLPFPSKFKSYTITDPKHLPIAFTKAEANPKIHTIIVDSLTFLMDQYETQYVLTAADGMKAWSDFQQFFKKLMQDNVAKSTKHVIFTAHTLTIYNAVSMVVETKVPVKGALKNNGIESFFSINLMTVKKSISDLEGFESTLLNITPQEEALGFKYCYQTQLTKETVNTRIRAPMGMFSTKETYIDNDIQLVMDRLEEYYI